MTERQFAESASSSDLVKKVAQLIREEMTDYLVDAANYANPEQAADKLADFAARAILALVAPHVREECAKIADAEPELPGDMPDEVKEGFRTIGPEEACRAIVRATKASIAAAIRATKP